ncbi:MAG: sulfite exporter TauE/SafE family protein [Deltaproteobacteria bacterium]|nr:sulfite exporter TauE/SafE family protein [Deltaproteobacteria bacterium]
MIQTALLDGLATGDLALAWAVVALAGMVRGFSGFGSALLMSPLFSIIFTPSQGVAIIVGMEMVGAWLLLPGAYRSINWKEVLPMAGAAWLAAPLGTTILLVLEPQAMRRIIALLVILLVALLASGWRWRGGRGALATLGAGGISGFLNGSTGAGGPPVVLYQLSGLGTPAVQRANIIAFFCIPNLGTWSGLIAGGVFTREVVALIFLLVPVYLAALHAGAVLFRRSGGHSYRRVVLLILLLVALLSLLA